jgi:hypothetical protein
MGDRATLGSDLSTIVMLYSIANALMSVGSFFRRAYIGSNNSDEIKMDQTL